MVVMDNSNLLKIMLLTKIYLFEDYKKMFVKFLGNFELQFNFAIKELRNLIIFANNLEQN